MNVSRSSNGIKDFGIRLAACFLILWTPFFFFSAFRGHPVPASALIYSALLFAIAALALALIMGRGRDFAQACDVTLIVTTPDLTAMTDAYAFLKVLLGRRPEPRPLILVNRVGSEEAAREVVQRIDRVCDRFLGVRPRSIGWIPEDVTVSACVNRRGSTWVAAWARISEAVTMPPPPSAPKRTTKSRSSIQRASHPTNHGS